MSAPTDPALDALREQLVQRSIVLGPEIGVGGTATVYEASDERHGRRVAVKVLDPIGEIDQREMRFDREIRLVAQLQHPHIVPLYDSGSAGGLRYFIMPLASGEPLRSRLANGPLPANEVIAIATEIADGLRYAHGMGVIHRDIKPGNILLEGGHAFIADFGIAESRNALLRTDPNTGEARFTAEGQFVGTVEYMAPEQLVGGVADERSDLYSLGCTLYEMLAGILPFDGSSPELCARAKLIGRFEPLAKRVPDAPPQLCEVVDGLLAEAPEARTKSAADLLDQLRAIRGSGSLASTLTAGVLAVRWVVMVGVVLVAATVAWLRTPGPLDPHRVVIAAFTNETGNPEMDGFGHRVTDWIDDALVKSERVEVITSAVDLPVTAARDSIEIGTTPERLGRLARETRAGTVVTGSYYQKGSELELQVEITDARSGQLAAAIGPVSGATSAPDSVAALVAERVVRSIDSLVAASQVRSKPI